jgi:D-glycero-D-manno-heptose 1,7-bisphosphate phosphatase
MSPAVFFDRDGTLIETLVVNGKPIADNEPETCRLLPGSMETCLALRAANIKTFLITNQPDIARGKVSAESVRIINEIVANKCGLTGIATCAHDDADECLCRKPRPGMITDLALHHGVNLQSSVVVGDRWRDVEAGRAAGCLTLFIDYGYDEPLVSEPTWKSSSISEAGLLLLQHFRIS